MNNYQLDQTLIVDPELPFTTLAAALEGLGWRREAPDLAAPPLLPGEPEWARWTWAGGKPFAVYTFNPVARLRVLDLATAPPAWRGAVAERLPLLGPERFAGLLQDPEPRRRLLGLWAIRACEGLDWLESVQALRADPEPVVAEQADQVAATLGRVTEARLEVLGSLALLAEGARSLIRRMAERPETIIGLKPDRDDCARLFNAGYAQGLAEGAAALYRNPPRANPGEDYPELDVTAAPAGLLRGPNVLSERFPRGYRDIAGWMSPERIWLSWAWRAKSGGAVRHDGLAWLDDHWVWFPKPFRLLASRLPGPPGRVH